ncbi:hypothetical protein QQ045_014219 [Rhodiola kirilowii]
MTAHPKVDAGTVEVFTFRYSVARPFLTYFHFDSKGNKQPDIHIFSMNQGSIFRDFAITKKHVIFSETQLVVNKLNKILAGGPPVGADLAKVPRLGVLPRYAIDESELMWFDALGLIQLPCKHEMERMDCWGSRRSIRRLAHNWPNA